MLLEIGRQINNLATYSATTAAVLLSDPTTTTTTTTSLGPGYDNSSNDGVVRLKACDISTGCKRVATEIKF